LKNEPVKLNSQSQGPPRVTPYRRLTVALSIGKSCSMMVLMIPISLLLTFKAEQIDAHNSTAVFSIVTAIGAIFALVANPLGGAVSDRTPLRFGRRRTWIMIGSILGSLAFAGIAWAKNVAWLTVFWCLAQLFYNFAFAAYMALVPDQVEESRRGAISGILGFALPVAIVVGYVLMIIMANTSLAARFGILGLVGIVSAVITCCMIVDPQTQYVKTGKKIALNAIYPSPKQYPAFTWGMLTRFFMSMTYSYQIYTAIMLTKRFHLNEVQTTSYTTLIEVLSLVAMGVSSILGGMLSDKIRKQKPFIVCSVIVMVIGLLIVAFISDMTVVTVGCVVINFGYGIYTAVDTALIARILPNQQDAAKDYGLMNVADTLPQSIVPAMAAPLIALGSWQLFYGVLAVCGVISAIVVHPIPEMSPVPEESVPAQEPSLDVGHTKLR